MVHVLTDEGLGVLRLEHWDLTRKALHYENMIEPRHYRHGYVSYCILKKYGDLRTYQLTADESDALWTSFYLGKQSRISIHVFVDTH